MKNKFLSALLSATIAFGMWLYVITVDAPDFTDTIYDIPVTFVNESLLNENGLIVTATPDTTVDLTLTGNRSDVIKCDRSNITIKVDLSKIYEAGEHELEYTPSYPSGISSNAFDVEKNPGTITVSIGKWSRKEIPVNVICEGAVPEGYIADTENVVKDYAAVTIEGPASVVDQIESAVIRIDLNDQKASISESCRYTLTDANGNAVDAETIEVNVEEIQVDLKIQCTKDVKLVIKLVDGGGATSSNAVLEYEPKTIKVAGSEMVLSELEEIVLGTINLADYLEATEFTYTIPTFEGVTNLSGITEVTAKLSFPSLTIMDFTVENFAVANVPEGMEAEMVTAKLTIKVRGPSADVKRLTPEDIIATVDFTDAQLGTSTFKVNVSFAEGFDKLGAVGSNTVTATVTQE